MLIISYGAHRLLQALHMLSELIPGAHISGSSASPEQEIFSTPQDKRESCAGRTALVCVAGAAVISDDFVCTGSNSEGFPSVGCRGYGVMKGKWYHEVTLLTANCIQLGWVDSGFVGNSDKGMCTPLFKCSSHEKDYHQDI